MGLFIHLTFHYSQTYLHFSLPHKLHNFTYSPCVHEAVVVGVGLGHSIEHRVLWGHRVGGGGAGGRVVPGEDDHSPAIMETGGHEEVVITAALYVVRLMCTWHDTDLSQAITAAVSGSLFSRLASSLSPSWAQSGKLRFRSWNGTNIVNLWCVSITLSLALFRVLRM